MLRVISVTAHYQGAWQFVRRVVSELLSDRYLQTCDLVPSKGWGSLRSLTWLTNPVLTESGTSRAVFGSTFFDDGHLLYLVLFHLVRTPYGR